MQPFFRQHRYTFHSKIGIDTLFASSTSTVSTNRIFQKLSTFDWIIYRSGSKKISIPIYSMFQVFTTRFHWKWFSAPLSWTFDTILCKIISLAFNSEKLKIVNESCSFWTVISNTRFRNLSHSTSIYRFHRCSWYLQIELWKWFLTNEIRGFIECAWFTEL